MDSPLGDSSPPTRILPLGGFPAMYPKSPFLANRPSATLTSNSAMSVRYCTSGLGLVSSSSKRGFFAIGLRLPFRFRFAGFGIARLGIVGFGIAGLGIARLGNAVPGITDRPIIDLGIASSLTGNQRNHADDNPQQRHGARPREPEGSEHFPRLFDFIVSLRGVRLRRGMTRGLRGRFCDSRLDLFTVTADRQTPTT